MKYVKNKPLNTLITTVGQRPMMPRDLLKIHHWSELAECQGSTDLFNLIDMESPEALALSDNPTIDIVRRVNVERIGKAMELCNRCEVRDRCLSDADEDDRKYTVRGGLWPTSVGRSGPGRPRKEAPKPPSVPCKHGHEANWYYRQDSKTWRCSTCKMIQVKAKRGARKTFDEHAKTCSKGHTDWYVYYRPSRNRPERRCRTCYTEAGRIRQAKKAGMVQSEDGN